MPAVVSITGPPGRASYSGFSASWHYRFGTTALLWRSVQRRGPVHRRLVVAHHERAICNLGQALAALRQDTCFADALGARFIDYYLRIKEFEIARFHAEVTEWEQREYFELF